MISDSNAALVTVDADGQPRVRTVKAFLDPVDPARPASGVTVWVTTRLTTRKIEQIRRHPKVNYARFFWPDFPRDLVMLEIRPRWLEYLGASVPNDRTSWRPQSVSFDGQVVAPRR